MFPKISKIVGKDPLRPALEHAIIQNGNLVATDSYMLVCIPVSTFIREGVDGDKIYTAEEQIANVEGKMFSVPLIKKLTVLRSEERRVGKECRSRWSPHH